MLSSRNLSKPATGAPIVNPTKDMVLGCFWMSKMKDGLDGEGRIFSSPSDARLAYDMGLINIKAKIKVRKDRDSLKFKGISVDKFISDDKFIETCAGRII